jgi:RNA polymerase sigma factor (sigma-70 family)
MVTSLIASHGTQLNRFLLARVRNAADVPDIVQEVYLRMLRIPSAESIRSPEAYLFTVAQHVLQQHQLRQSAIPPVTELTDALSALAVSHGVDPAQTLDAHQCLERLQVALDELTPKARATFILHRRDGLSLSQIGECLGLSVPMVKKYLMKSLLHLRRRIQE